MDNKRKREEEDKCPHFKRVGSGHYDILHETQPKQELADEREIERKDKLRAIECQRR